MFTKFEKAVFFAVEGRDLENECDNSVYDVSVRDEPVDHFRPVDVMSGKRQELRKTLRTVKL